MNLAFLLKRCAHATAVLFILIFINKICERYAQMLVFLSKPPQLRKYANVSEHCRTLSGGKQACQKI